MFKITELSPFTKGGVDNLILEKVYFMGCKQSNWVHKLNSNGLSVYEYKTAKYYTYDPIKAQALVDLEYAIWDEQPIDIQWEDKYYTHQGAYKVAYQINMLRIY